jgi:hypothetical protein
MGEWQAAETNTHQDHVIAHVLGATVLGYFSWDETAYLLLDIGFIWNIYLDGEMGLVPQAAAIAELDAEDEMRSDLRDDVDLIGRGVVGDLKRMKRTGPGSPIVNVEFSMTDKCRRIHLICEESSLIVETSLETADVNIYEQ